MKTISIIEAKQQIEELVERINQDSQPIVLTGENGNAVLISESEWQAIQTTLYLQSIPGMETSIHQGGETPLEECVDEQIIRDILNG